MEVPLILSAQPLRNKEHEGTCACSVKPAEGCSWCSIMPSDEDLSRHNTNAAPSAATSAATPTTASRSASRQASNPASPCPSSSCNTLEECLDCATIGKAVQEASPQLYQPRTPVERQKEDATQVPLKPRSPVKYTLPRPERKI